MNVCAISDFQKFVDLMKYVELMKGVVVNFKSFVLCVEVLDLVA